MYAMARDNMAVLKQFFLEQREHLGGKLDTLHEVAQIPTRDIPTVEELLEQAKSDPTRRKLLESTLAELEFSDPQIEFN